MCTTTACELKHIGLLLTITSFGPCVLLTFDSSVFALQADQIRQALEEYASSDVWALEPDACGNPTILLGEHDTAS